ncbi:MAG: repressor LexA [Clostridia bacterium]|nr:repressor LexA [Clostridia bacterium]
MRSKDRRIKDLIKAYIEERAERGGNCPSCRDTARELGISASTVCRYLSAMEADGELVLGEFGYETAAMSRTDRESVSVAILGDVPCGSLTEEYEHCEGYVRLPASLVGRGEFFLLKAYGESMIDAGISDGDLVLVRRQSDAADGDIVVALVDGAVTLKRMYRDARRRHIVLHPENSTMSDIIAEYCEIQGVAVKVIKDLGRHG